MGCGLSSEAAAALPVPVSIFQDNQCHCNSINNTVTIDISKSIVYIHAYESLCHRGFLYFILQSSPDEALELAMKHGDIQALEKALETHANVNKRVKDEHGTECTILHMAARVGNGEAIKMILKVRLSSN